MTKVIKLEGHIYAAHHKFHTVIRIEIDKDGKVKGTLHSDYYNRGHDELRVVGYYDRPKQVLCLAHQQRKGRSPFIIYHLLQLHHDEFSGKWELGEPISYHGNHELNDHHTRELIHHCVHMHSPMGRINLEVRKHKELLREIIS